MRSTVADAANGLNFVALPQDSEDWEVLQDIQLAQAERTLTKRSKHL